MGNTLENKAKFFGLYILQRVLKDSDCSENVQASVLVTPNNVFSSQYLELKPLHIISDEQAIELCKAVSPLSFENDKYKWKVVRDSEIGFLTVSSKQSYHSFSFSFINGRVFMYDGDELSNNYWIITKRIYSLSIQAFMLVMGQK